MKKTLSRVHVIALLVVAAPAAATPEQDIQRAYNQFTGRHWADALASAQRYLTQNGPRFSAAFIVAASGCMLHQHLQSNAQPFHALLLDYQLPSDKKREVNDWMKHCTSPKPAQPATGGNGVGVSTSGLTVEPSFSAARPSNNEPQTNLPTPNPGAPIKVIPRKPKPLPDKSTAITVQPKVGIAAIAVDACIPGHVWREAFSGDHVCVIPQRRAEAAADNAAAASRRVPNGAYGPNTCVSGYVWREAQPGDVVCVIPERRTQTAQENQQAASRRVH